MERWKNRQMRNTRKCLVIFLKLKTPVQNNVIYIHYESNECNIHSSIRSVPFFLILVLLLQHWPHPHCF